MRRPVALLAALLVAMPVGAGELAADLGEVLLRDWGSPLPVQARIEVTLARDAPRDGAITHVALDRHSGRFTAWLRAGSDEEVRVQGTMRAVVPVLAAARALKADAPIAAADLVEIELPVARYGAQMVTDPDEVLGLALRYPLAEGRPLTRLALMAPRLVRRGETVTLIFRSGGIELRAPAKALSDGAQGAVLKVVNLASNSTVTAVVLGPQTVGISR